MKHYWNLWYLKLLFRWVYLENIWKFSCSSNMTTNNNMNGRNILYCLWLKFMVSMGLFGKMLSVLNFLKYDWIIAKAYGFYLSRCIVSFFSLSVGYLPLFNRRLSNLVWHLRFYILVFNYKSNMGKKKPRHRISLSPI